MHTSEAASPPHDGFHKFRITADELRDYRAAVEDATTPGSCAPPLFSMVWGRTALERTIEEAITGSDLRAVVHLAQDTTVERAPNMGESVWSMGEVVGIQAHSSGAILQARVTTVDSSDQEVGAFMTTLLLSGARLESVGQVVDPPRRPVRGVANVVHRTTDEDQARRYADASGDSNPIHLDAAAAAAAGLPAPVLQGMCSLAIAVSAVAVELALPLERLRRVSARFSRPLIPGQPMRVGFTVPESPNGFASFRVDAPYGTVIRGGSLEW